MGAYISELSGRFSATVLTAQFRSLQEPGKSDPAAMEDLPAAQDYPAALVSGHRPLFRALGDGLNAPKRREWRNQLESGSSTANQ